MGDDVEIVSLLGEPVRRRLYEYVVAQPDAVGRDEAAAVVGIKRSLAAFHLDKLTEEGLLEVEFRRLTGKTGPGAGRPAKLYRRSDREIAVSLPQREYELAARLFARALERAEERDALRDVATGFGREIAQQARKRAGRRRGRQSLTRAAEETLREYGFEPFHDADGALRLRNCPFHALSREHTDLVCGMNLDIMTALVQDLGLEGLAPRLEPRPGLCCVAFHAR